MPMTNYWPASEDMLCLRRVTIEFVDQPPKTMQVWALNNRDAFVVARIHELPGFVSAFAEPMPN
jgi:hypothetical protein